MSSLEKFVAMQALPLIDHTSLNDTDTEESINSFCSTAFNSSIPPACLMTYPKFVSYVKTIKPKDCSIPVATVINFPHGANSHEEVVQEAKDVLEMGVDEIDMVMNYTRYLKDPENGLRFSYDMIAAVKDLCNSSIKPVILKVILETGKIIEKDLIYNASMNALEAGADFIKTSTGKVAINATPEAAEVMMKALKDFVNKHPEKRGKVGFKAAGGVKTLEDTAQYMNLAQDYMGVDFIHKNMRFGASSLLKVLLGKASGQNVAYKGSY